MDDTQSARFYRRKRNFFSYVWDKWVRVSALQPQQSDGDIRVQELLRRSRLFSGLLLIVLATVIIEIPALITNPLIRIPLLIVVLLALVALWFNRRGMVNLAALCFIVAIDAACMRLVISEHIVGYGLVNFDLLVISLFIGGLVISYEVIPIIGIAQIALIIVVFLVVPHDPLLDKTRAPFQDLSAALILEVAGTTIAWIGSFSISRALRRASRAEELIALRARFDEQTRSVYEQKQRLEYGINILKTVQSRVANGDYKARVDLQGNELLPVGVSFNLLVERLEHTLTVEGEYRQLQSRFQYLINICHAYNSNTVPDKLNGVKYTGTSADVIISTLEHLSLTLSTIKQASIEAEDVYSLLQQQKARFLNVVMNSNMLLSQMNSFFSEPSDLERNGTSEQFSSRPSPYYASEQRRKKQLVENVDASLAEVQQQGVQGMQKLRYLIQLLKDASYNVPKRYYSVSNSGVSNSGIRKAKWRSL